ncbi:MAG: MMPL family transporter [Nocardioides sp.]
MHDRSHALDPRRPSPVRVITGPRTAWAVALLGLLLAGGAILGLGEAERDAAATDALPRGADSTTVVDLQDQLPDEDTAAAVVLWTADGDAGLTDDQQSALPGVLTDVGAALDLPTGGPPPRTSEDGTAAVAVLPVPQLSASDNADLVTELRAALDAATPAGVTVQVTGPAAVQADLAAVFDGADTTLLLTTAGVVALLLLLTYRSPVLWVIPLVVVGAADRLAAVLGTQALSGLGMAWDESTVGILSVLVFGAGTDYALLLISRYRDELRTHESRHEAMALALRRTAEAVLSSSTTVVLGLLTLLLSAFPTTRGLGLACAIGIVVAAAFVLLVLPAAMVLFGRWVFWPRVPRLGQTPLVESRSLWRWVGDRVSARPVSFLLVSAVVLAALATGLTRVETGLGSADQFLDTPEAITAAERLGESFPAGSSDPVQVLTRSDPDAVVAAVGDLDEVVSAEVARRGDGLTEVAVVLGVAAGTPGSEAAVEEIRAAVDGLGETYVGGTEAQAIDAAAASARDRLVIFPLIALLVLLALGVLLRSVVAPLLLVSTVLATYVSALGLSWWLFTGVFGFPALDVGVPLLAFLFLVALGVDYNIFLVSRAAEEARDHGARAGMLRGLSATGGVITSAGILLAAVFAVLGVLPLVVLAQLGVVICVGVLLDTLLVRTIVVPAFGIVLGDRFWWPRRVGPSPSAEGGGSGAGL